MAAPQLKTKPSGIYFVEFEDADTGKRRRVSTNTRDREVARRMMRDIVLGIAPQASTGKVHKTTGRITMQKLFDRAERTVWSPSETKSQGTVRSNLKILGGLIGDVEVADMTYSRLEQLVGQLRDKGYAPGTIKRKMDMVSKALRMATIWTDDRGRPLLAAKPVMPSIRVSNLKERVLERHEEAAVWNAIEHRRQTEPNRQWWRFAKLVRFLLDTAARLGEALGTGPDNIATMQDQRYVTFARYRTKNDKPRTIPLTATVSADLDELRTHIALRDGAWSYFPMKESLAWYMWNQVREDVRAAGINIDDVTLHTLRHTCLTRLAQGGMDLLSLQKWAGHSDPKITADRYVHLRPSDLVSGLSILQSNGAPAPIGSQHGGKSVSALGSEATANRGNPDAARLN